MPLSYVYRGGAVRFRLLLWPFATCACIICLGIALFGNKFLIIQKKKEKKKNSLFIDLKPYIFPLEAVAFALSVPQISNLRLKEGLLTRLFNKLGPFLHFLLEFLWMMGSN